MRIQLALAATLAIASHSALAANAQPYYGVQGTYYEPDNLRRNDSGLGATVYLGLPANQFLASELSFFGVRADNQVGTSFDKQWGGGIDLVVTPFQRKQRFVPFVLIGSGVQYDDRRVNQGSHTFANAGGGFLYDLSQDGLVSLRVDGKRIRANDDDVVAGRDNLWDTRVNAGIQVAFRPDPVPVIVVQTPPLPPVGDADGDGVPDDRDQCPGTVPGRLVNNVGCPAEPPPPPTPPPAPVDSDQDGVLDNVDACPSTPFGFKVDERGCAIKAAKIVLRDINFEFNKSTLTAGARTSLDKVAEGLRGQPSMSLVIEGHTDSVGGDPYNLKLSKQRAASAKAYLVEQGIEARRLDTNGYGESQPVASNKTPDGRAENRRVEFKVTQQ